jgi:hypothetical protein
VPHVGDGLVQVGVERPGDATGHGHDKHPLGELAVVSLLQGLQQPGLDPKPLGQGLPGQIRPLSGFG